MTKSSGSEKNISDITDFQAAYLNEKKCRLLGRTTFK